MKLCMADDNRTARHRLSPKPSMQKAESTRAQNLLKRTTPPGAGLVAWRVLSVLLVLLTCVILCTQYASADERPPGQVGDVAAEVSADPGNGSSRRTALIGSITIFVLAIFVGFEVITKVPPTLHTPLMSGSNAISGITLVGALLAAGAKQMDVAAVIGTLAVVMATINVVGGFLVTHRMLSMFRRKG